MEEIKGEIIMQKCRVCGLLLDHVTTFHMASHGLTREEYEALPNPYVHKGFVITRAKDRDKGEEDYMGYISQLHVDVKQNKRRKTPKKGVV